MMEPYMFMYIVIACVIAAFYAELCCHTANLNYLMSPP